MTPAKLIDADGASVEVPAELVDVLIATGRQLQTSKGVSVAALHTDLTAVEAVELASEREIRLTLRVRTGKLNPMAGTPVRVELSDDVADVVRREASRTGRSEAEVVELAVKRLVAPSILDRLWDRAELTQGEAMAIAVEEVNAARAERNAS